MIAAIAGKLKRSTIVAIIRKPHFSDRSDHSIPQRSLKSDSPYHRNDCWTFFFRDRSDCRSDHMESSLKQTRIMIYVKRWCSMHILRLIPIWIRFSYCIMNHIDFNTANRPSFSSLERVHTLCGTGSHKIMYPVQIREAKTHTLSTGTSP